MNNIKKFKKVNKDVYPSDEELVKMIADIESEPLLRPPKEFKNEIIGQIRRKRKYRKNVQLFSYSVKVIAATAAAVAIVFIVPANIGAENGADMVQSYMKERQTYEQEAYTGNPIWQFNRKINEHYDRLNNGLNNLVRMEVNFNEKEKE